MLATWVKTLYRECCKLLDIQLRYLTFTQLSQLEKKTENKFLVICLIERHKDNNDRSRKKSPNLYSPDHAYAWNFETTKFRNVHRLPPVTWVTYGKNFRCVVAKWVNKLNWKNQSRWFSHGNLFLWFPISVLKFCVNWFQQIPRN